MLTPVLMFLPVLCAIHQPPARLFRPMPVPRSPLDSYSPDIALLTHIETGLPPSQGNTVILTIVDRVSKAVHFVALPKLPTALETTDLLVQHVFCHHGIPQDKVSDWGPKFTSQVWNSFCQALGASSSLSSGYHPQTNSQMEQANPEQAN